MADEDRMHSTEIYNALVANPANVLGRLPLTIYRLPTVPDATAANLVFAANHHGMVIDNTAVSACGLLAADLDAAINRQMLVSNMRDSARTPGSNAGQRHEPTRVVAGNAGEDLWVTELQTGCTVLIIDWGRGRYSLFHLQPNEDNQFNSVGQRVMNLGAYTSRVTGPEFFRSAYKNTWLKQEATSVVANTGGTPQYYIMIQSMFDAAAKKAVQVIGVRQRGGYEFYRQRARGRTLTVDHLTWSGWYSYVPYRSY